MREQVRIERQTRLENFLQKIETAPPPPHLVGRRTKTLLDLSLGHARAKDPAWPHSKITHKNLFSRSSDGFLHMYVHTPVQQRAADALAALKNGNKKEAIKIYEESINRLNCFSKKKDNTNKITNYFLPITNYFLPITKKSITKKSITKKSITNPKNLTIQISEVEVSYSPK